MSGSPTIPVAIGIAQNANLFPAPNGWRRDNPYMQAGADYLRANLPAWDTADGQKRDSYYWYYATQVMFQVGGSHWEEWNGRLRT